jgi:hypothetical protein
MKHQQHGRVKKKVHIETLRVRNTRALPERAASVGKSLQLVFSVFRTLFSDENFLTLLEAETLIAIPLCLKPLFEEGRTGHEIRE